MKNRFLYHENEIFLIDESLKRCAIEKGYVCFSGKIGSFYSEMVNKSYLMNVMFLFLIEFCSKIELCKAHQGSECFRLVFSTQFHNKINLINYTHPPVDLTQTIFGIHIIRIWNIPKRSSKLSIPKLSFCSCLVSKMFWNSFEKFIKYFLRTKPKNHVQSGIINFVYVKNHKKTRKPR